jgi:hypothetical protein
MSSVGHAGLVGLSAADIVTGGALSVLSVGVLAVSFLAGQRRDGPVTHVTVPGFARLPMASLDSGATSITFDTRGELKLHVTLRAPREHFPFFRKKQRFTLTGDAAREGLSSAIVGVNQYGATRKEVQAAVTQVENAETIESLLKRFAANDRNSSEYYPGILAYKPPEQRFALEMLLHEEDERRAMAGELGDLYARWQDAERIAAIADAELTPLPSHES